MKPTLVLHARELAKSAKTIADRLARKCGSEVYVVAKRVSNPTLVAHGLVASSRWHLVTHVDREKHPHEQPRAVADIYAGSASAAKEIAEHFANLLGRQLDLLANRARPKRLEDHPASRIRPRQQNPSLPKPGERWRHLSGNQFATITSVSTDRIVVLGSDGQRAWFDRGEFMSEWKPASKRHALNPSRSTTKRISRKLNRLIAGGSSRVRRAKGARKAYLQKTHVQRAARRLARNPKRRNPDIRFTPDIEGVIAKTSVGSALKVKAVQDLARYRLMIWLRSHFKHNKSVAKDEIRGQWVSALIHAASILKRPSPNPRGRNPKREGTRTRVRGTRVTVPSSPAERIAAIRKIVEEHQYAKVDGVMVDGFSASAIIQVYDAINPENQAKYAAMPVSKMASIAFQLLKKQNPCSNPKPGRPGNDRDFAAKTIRDSLKKRSGKSWSVTVGRGTAWGWLHLDSPNARRTWRWRLKPGMPDWPENYEEYDAGTPGGHASPTERAELARLLGLEKLNSYQGVSIPGANDYYDEYMDRAQGRTPERIGVPYWDNPSRSATARARRRGVVSHRQRRAIRKAQRAGTLKSPQARYQIVSQIRRGMKRGLPHGRSANPGGQIAAYIERASYDPETGAEGILRTEWRLGKTDWDAARQWAGPHATIGPVMLEQRYIRRGTAEPWKMHDTFATRAAAFDGIPMGATAVAPEMVRIEAKRLAANQAAKTAREKMEAAMERDQRLASVRRASGQAFDRLLKSGNERHQQLALAWNDMMLSLRSLNKTVIARLRGNLEFKRLHDAVIEAVTMPAKAKAIAAFMKHGRAHVFGRTANPRGRNPLVWKRGAPDSLGRPAFDGWRAETPVGDYYITPHRGQTRAQMLSGSTERPKGKLLGYTVQLNSNTVLENGYHWKDLGAFEPQRLHEAKGRAALDYVARTGRHRNPRGPKAKTRTRQRVTAGSRRPGARSTMAARGRSANPGNEALAKAAKLNRMFQDRGPIRVKTQHIARPKPMGAAVAKIGKLVAVVYETDKFDGKTRHYEHEFDNPKPLLVADPETQDLNIARGPSKYKLAADGIMN